MRFLSFFSLLVLRLAAAPAASSSLTLAIDPSPGQTFVATVTGPAGSVPTGAFRGRAALNGSPVELAVTGRAVRAGGRLTIRTTLRYSDIPSDWAARYRPFSADVRLTGEVAGAPVSWQGRVAWQDVAMSGSAATAGRFLALAQVRVTHVAASASTGVADLRVTNPFSFPLTIASSEYRIEASEREIGRGATRGILVRPARASTISFPVEVDHGQLIAAAGRALLSSGEVDVRLRGWLSIRLPGGDVRIPLDLAGRLEVGDL